MKYGFLLLFILGGCATQPEVVTTEKAPTRVEIPVTVKCVDLKEVPAVPKTAMDPKGDLKQKAAGAYADVLALEAYSGRLRALLEACAR